MNGDPDGRAADARAGPRKGLAFASEVWYEMVVGKIETCEAWTSLATFRQPVEREQLDAHVA